MYIRIKGGMLPSGGLFASLSSPTSEQVCKKGGGGGDGGIAPGNRLLATTMALQGFLTLRSDPGLGL